MLIDHVLKEAKADLDGLFVKDVVIGISFVGVQLSDDSVAFIYLMRENLPSGCSIFPYGMEMIGMDAFEAAQWLKNGAEDLQRSLGCAVLDAASSELKNPASAGQMDILYQTITEKDTVGVIGHMPPLLKNLAPRVKRYISFDRAIDMQGTVEGASVYPVAMQKELLPQCDVVIISGTTMINHSTEPIIAMSTNARDIALVGFSVPFYPKAYKNSGLTAISGVQFKNDCKETLFKKVSMGCGRLTMHAYTHGHFVKL